MVIRMVRTVLKQKVKIGQNGHHDGQDNRQHGQNSSQGGHSRTRMVVMLIKTVVLSGLSRLSLDW